MFPNTKVTDILAPGKFRIYYLSTRVFVGGKRTTYSEFKLKPRSVIPTARVDKSL